MSNAKPGTLRAGLEWADKAARVRRWVPEEGFLANYDSIKRAEEEVIEVSTEGEYTLTKLEGGKLKKTDRRGRSTYTFNHDW